ncbi:hypothetical protein HNP82_001817 [Catenibacillus scindens]|uniref:DUF3795 domain-containing protein n=1 Tax=Catenibacillus scindens TaxID=673271 RepID=A0A7W8HA38_9FIRM|nr:hypothetical protein [Catenibacillus scindens]MBB5264689.1 hypothetical protein [Catenibacillus scindens]
MTENSIAYCGLLCGLCHPEGDCNCKFENHCSKQSSARGCFQYNCCSSKNLNGCWECTESPCGIDMHTLDNVKIRAFIRCIKEDGLEKFISYIENNMGQGLVYHRHGFTGDYDLETEDAVLELLRHGKIK